MCKKMFLYAVGSLFLALDELEKAVNEASHSIEEKREKVDQNISKLRAKSVKSVE
jgi:hypothetical protein